MPSLSALYKSSTSAALPTELPGQLSRWGAQILNTIETGAHK